MKRLLTFQRATKRETGKNTEILNFSKLATIENSHALKRFAKTQSNYIIQGCADDLYESFPFVVRIANCNVHHHGNNPG